jgi:phosphonate transport system substrate-binding protein
VLIARRGQFDDLDRLDGARIVAGPARDVGPQLLALVTIEDGRPAGRSAAMLRASSHSEAERIFRSGEADLLVGWEPAYASDGVEPRTGALARLVDAGMERNELQTVWSSEPVAYGPHAVRKDMPEELKHRLVRFLVNLVDQQPDIYQLLEPYRGGGFARMDAAGYALARKIATGLASR